MSAQKTKADWLAWLKISHSESTLNAYEWEIGKLEQTFPGREIAQLAESDLLRYVSERRDRAGRRDEVMSTASIKRTVNALRSYYGYIGSPAARSVPMPRVKKRVQRTLDWEEADRVLTVCDTSTLRGRRDVALMAVMLDAGLRAAEICRLSIDKVNLKSRLLFVVTKGGDEKFGAFSFVTANYLSSWFALREGIAKTDRVFCTLELHRVGEALSTEGLRCIFRSIGRRAGVKGFTPHVLRRSFATFMTRLGSPTRITQLAGRWERIEEVEQYTRAVQLDPDLIAPYLPMNRLGGGEPLNGLFNGPLPK
jgi:site-specific recombinase XerD